MAWEVILFTVLGAALIVAAVITYGSLRWQASTRELRAALEAVRLPSHPEYYSEQELNGLPAPVQRYFRAVLADGQPVISAIGMEHHGTFNMSESGKAWRPFSSDQRVITRRPGFDWDARIKMPPGLAVHVHDAYIAGEGILQVSLAGLIPLASLRGTPQMAQGELMRFLAEAPWYPTALLPSQGVLWKPVNEYAASATIGDGDVSATLLFRFNRQGVIESVHAEARGRMVSGEIVPTAREGRWKDYQLCDGIRIPFEGEVSWILPDGPKPYWRGRLAGIRYEQ